MNPGGPDAGLFVQARHGLAEGPFWFEHRWWWVDIEGGVLHSRDHAGGDPWSYSFGRRITTVGPAPDGCWLVAFAREIVWWDRHSGSQQILARLEGEPPENRFNDGKWDPAGRFVIGTLNEKGERGCAGLYSLEPGGRLTRLRDGVNLSNGMAWNADGKTFYHIDTRAYEIAAYDYDAGSGAISNRRIAVQVPEEMGLPDGMDIDSEGNLWVAHWGGGAVRCWSPRSGECLGEVRVPCRRPTSCCFGGYDNRRLLITTAFSGGDEGETITHPLSGSIFVWNVDRKADALPR